MEKFNVIYADPPWEYNDKALNRGGALRYYETMTLADICQLPVQDIAAKDCALFLWVTWPYIFECEKVINAWGFKYKTDAFTWVKRNKKTDSLFWGMGHWTRANSEICLLATKGKPKRESAAVHQIIYAPVGEHSQKPAEARERIVKLCGNVPRIELFARQETPGWNVWGNEVNSSIDLLKIKGA